MCPVLFSHVPTHGSRPKRKLAPDQASIYGGAEIQLCNLVTGQCIEIQAPSSYKRDLGQQLMPKGKERKGEERDQESMAEANDPL